MNRSSLTRNFLLAAIVVVVPATWSIGLSHGISFTSVEKVDFVQDIRPILSEHCFACHGPDGAARKGGLSFVDAVSAMKELKSGSHAIVPGSRDESELWWRISDPDDPMPPSEEKNPLTAEQIELLGRWIDEGAPFAAHWAYVAPQETQVPAGSSAWATTDIDHYISRRLAEEGLVPAEDADATTLIRRLHLDLSGLPPSPAQVARYLSGSRSQAEYQSEVDRLLEDPHFGERFASFWLDLVRYADTVGYHGDQEHRSWPYRDWVIRAFNNNMPFDRFTIEQIAGDLLEDPDQDQLIATGYNRLLQTSHEGGLQLKEYRAIYMADRVRNLSETWMGATLGCAQCHDHKYDPYTTRDFYSMGAFFADIDDEEHLRNPYGGLNTTPTKRTPEMRLTSAASKAREQQIADEMVTVEVSIAAAIADLVGEQATWEEQLKHEIALGGRHQQIWIDDELDTGGTVKGEWNFVRVDGIEPHSGERYRKQTSGGLVQHYTVDTTLKEIEVSEGEILFAWVHLDADTPPSAVMLQCNSAGDWNHRAVWGGDQIAYGRSAASSPAYQRMGALPPSGEWVRLEVPLEKLGLKAGQVISGIAFTQFGGTVYWDLCGVEGGSLAPSAVIDALALPVEQRSAQHHELLREHHASESPQVNSLRKQLGALKKQASSIESGLPLALYTRRLETPRTVHILPRGNWLDESGEVVEAAIPSFLGKLSGAGRRTRLDLARWLVTPESEGGIAGLTSRVFVNRVWAQLFGEGLCPSVEDFGGQGRPVTHAHLLDHLSRQFIASGWDIQQLIRTMVLSRSYRLSSRPGSVAQRVDPENLLFSHQSRHRMPAEMVRDTALKISGLLVDQLGGASVKPPQPPHYYRHLNFPPRRYKADVGAEQWRRGVYVHWQRQYLHPMLLAFDAPTREDCIARRNRSNTPLAALVLLNDPVFVEAARAFARRIVRWQASDQLSASDDGDSHRQAVEFAMKEAISRTPTEPEIDVLMTLLTSSRDHYRSNPDAALELLGGPGMEDRSLSEVPELAAWTEVARAILNLHETMTRE